MEMVEHRYTFGVYAMYNSTAQARSLMEFMVSNGPRDF